MRRTTAAVCAALSFVVAACASDETGPTSAPYTERTDETARAPRSPDAIIAGGNCTDSSDDEGQADLEMQDFVFAPPCLVIGADQGLRLHNEGAATHNFSVEGFAGLDVDLRPKEQNNTEPLGLDPGKYTFFCKFHEESKDMKGVLRVEAE